MILTQNNLESITAKSLIKPHEDIFNLPEKVIQFGTGVLLRGLPDYFIDKANRNGLFNGRVLIVKSTSGGANDAFSAQNNLYTLCVKGIENGQLVEENSINASISRVLSATEDWAAILKAAHQPDMQVVISNTTEVGIVASEDKITDAPPKTYPGKLLAFLHERFKAFGGSAESGMVILPTELISDNADKLKNILLELAESNQLGTTFQSWLTTANFFCKTLVDRIVPGKLPATEEKQMAEKLGYQDNLMIMAEPFRLWAIESNNQKVKDILSFAAADEGVFIVPSIEKFKTLKLRLLNGTHTISCGLAILAGFKTVKEAMADADFSAFVLKVMQNEIAPSIVGADITLKEALNFAQSVVDRFRNPALAHQWSAIILNYSSKLQMRNVAIIKQYYALHQQVPALTALGFAAYILLMKVQHHQGVYSAHINGENYPIQDEFAEILYQNWLAPAQVVETTLSNVKLWGEDLTQYPGFTEAIKNNINLIQNIGAKETLSKLQA